MLDGHLRDLESRLHFGGEECAVSYGLDPIALLAELAAASAKLRAAIPEAHAALLRALPDSLRVGDVLFVHAGIRPGVAPDAQAPQDLRWIRSPFLRSTADHGVLVVHGHTVVGEPEIHPNRIAIDTVPLRPAASRRSASTAATAASSRPAANTYTKKPARVARGLFEICNRKLLIGRGLRLRPGACRPAASSSGG